MFIQVYENSSKISHSITACVEAIWLPQSCILTINKLVYYGHDQHHHMI